MMSAWVKQIAVQRVKGFAFRVIEIGVDYRWMDYRLDLRGGSYYLR